MVPISNVFTNQNLPFAEEQYVVPVKLLCFASRTIFMSEKLSVK